METVPSEFNQKLNMYQQGIEIRKMVAEAEYQQAMAEIRHLVEGEPDRASPESSFLSETMRRR
jgi:hypothetical protein